MKVIDAFKITAVTAIVCSALVANEAFGGQAQGASITGQVVDDTGAVVPGVTVSATSPALQVPEVLTVTNERGEYRITPLPIGTYTVTYSLPGFQTVRREDIRLTIGFVAKIDVSMKIGAVEESITVTSAPPVVDVTATGATAQLTRETLELTPSTRNGLLSLLAQTPGARSVIDIGGNNFAAIPTFHAYGQDGQSWATLEGVMTTTPTDSGSGNYWDYTTFEETKVQALGKNADIPVRGVNLNAIVKSGSNDFHGSAFYSGSSQKLETSNLDATLAREGITSGGKLQSVGDTSGDIGGRIILNKLWFYASGRRRWTGSQVLGVNVDNGCTLGGCQLTSRPAVYQQHEDFGTGKISYQMTPSNRFIGFYNKAIKYDDGSNVTLLVPWTSRTTGHIHASVSKIEWNGVKGNLTMSLLFGRWAFQSNYDAHDNGVPSSSDLTTGLHWGDTNSASHKQGRNNSRGTLNWYKSGFMGNHELRTGFDYMDAFNYNYQAVPRSGDIALIYASLAPFEIVTDNLPVYNDPSIGNNVGIYVSDAWTIRRRLTLNMGVRYAHEHDFVPAQCRQRGVFAAAGCISEIDFPTWNSLAPRISFGYDMTGDGRTAIKGGWARYSHARDLAEVTNANPNSIITTTYKWHDSNNDGLYEPGEVELATNGPDFVTQSAGGNAVPDPHEIQPKQDEYFVSIERQFAGSLGVRMTGDYARAYDNSRTVNLLRPYNAYNIPITNPIPAPDGTLASGNPYGAITYYDYPAAYAGSQFTQNEITVLPGQPAQTFKTMEVAGSKRLTRGLQFTASYSATKKNIPFAEKLAYIPNAEINNADKTWEWLGRASAAYVMPHDITVSANFQNISGAATARTAVFRGGKQIPSITLNVAPIGSVRVPSTNNLDVRVEKALALATKQRLLIRLNVYNALNANRATALNVLSGAKYLFPTAIMPPRILELGASYSF